MLDRPEEYERMAAVEARLWWYRALHHLVERAIARHPKGHEARIVDAGCGTGGLLQFLRGHGCVNLSGFDLSPHAVTACQQRGLPVTLGDLRDLPPWITSGSADVLVSNDTLYFFPMEEQARIIRRMATALAPGGLLILNLPALDAFRGIHDLSVGISRRYTRRDLRALLSSEAWLGCRVCFWPCLLAPAIFCRRLAQRIRLRRSPQVTVRSDLDLPPAALNFLFERITRLENRMLPWKPFGSSLFVVAQRKDGRGLGGGSANQGFGMRPTR